METKNKKILFITYRNFFPITSGEKITMMQNLIILSKHFDVDCLILDDGTSSTSSNNELKKYAKNITYIKQSSLLFKACHCIFNLFFGKPLQNGYFYSRKMKKYITDNYKKYDALFCMHMRTGQYVEHIKDIKKYIDCPDCITLNSKNEYMNSKGLRKILFKIDYKYTRRYEPKLYESFNSIYVINERDKQMLFQMNEKLKNKLFVLYNYVRDLGYKKENEIINGNSICFLGRVAYGPNTAAIKYFVKEIFPSLKEKYPDLVFNVYGGSVTKAIKKLEKINGVKIHGFVDDVAKEIQSNNFVVAPMISGSGTQNKILECMMLKKLVITTKIGIDGLDDISNREIITCYDKNDFIKQCLYFLSSNSISSRKEIESSAQQYILSYYSFANSEKQLLSGI